MHKYDYHFLTFGHEILDMNELHRCNEETRAMRERCEKKKKKTAGNGTKNREIK